MNSGEKLIRFRERAGMTQAKLSDVSRVPQTTISGIENTDKTPGLITATKLADALGIDVKELLPEKEVTK
ncbi:helix-turn-helix transcriptional regulator [Secundilactobacillus kimchicus]|uniref:HTH cro/C1-type domain-containing protein n=1 Tax=Secundilactobacillus kimchicus JCM 15530 TaxID=1302272 RepID=A0A0R1HUE1_9LACO|nr:helix-turn-helix transcriptional regulator [Secundilactobacillus kimchicus]KRK48163.1 hypothetical protein FC96_GL001899 [Secundilactobacillus kimchicus JCM 15530]MBT9670883.1 helix-turn-helix domain-containing protein [Secundilactobacillus kimchicus]